MGGDPARAGDAGSDVRGRLVAVWKRVLALSWPVMLEQTFRTMMRTTDIVVTALFSPVAVAAIGLADLYARFPLWVGLGLGAGAIALSSQDTGSGADANRDEAISGALLLGALLGVPFVAFGLLFGREAVALLGAPAEVARTGGLYLTVIFATAPARHVGLIAARSLQGTGDTRTPMYVNVAGNLLNIALSVVLGLGLLGAPRLEVLGVGLATATANVVIAVALLAALAGTWADAGLTVPSDPVVARQLVVVSAPSVAEGLASTLAEFPLNAILLGFGTEVNAAFQIGRRVYQQVTSPLSRGLNVGASVVVGQALGAGDAARARFEGWATTALGVVTVGTIGLVLVAAAPALAGLLVEGETARTTVEFARVYGLTAGAPGRAARRERDPGPVRRAHHRDVRVDGRRHLPARGRARLRRARGVRRHRGDVRLDGARGGGILPTRELGRACDRDDGRTWKRDPGLTRREAMGGWRDPRARAPHAFGGTPYPQWKPPRHP